MSLQPTRRGFIAGLLLLPLTQTTTKAGPESVTISPNEEIAILLRRREELLEQRRQLDERWKIAYAQLPDWCRPGPKYRDAEGNEFGQRVGWPAIPKIILVEKSTMLLRPSPFDLRELRSLDERTAERADAQRNYRQRIHSVRCAMSERRKISAKLGLPRTRDWLPIDLEIEAIESRLAVFG